MFGGWVIQLLVSLESSVSLWLWHLLFIQYWCLQYGSWYIVRCHYLHCLYCNIHGTCLQSNLIWHGFCYPNNANDEICTLHEPLMYFQISSTYIFFLHSFLFNAICDLISNSNKSLFTPTIQVIFCLSWPLLSLLLSKIQLFLLGLFPYMTKSTNAVFFYLVFNICHFQLFTYVLIIYDNRT